MTLSYRRCRLETSTATTIVLSILLLTTWPTNRRRLLGIFLFLTLDVDGGQFALAQHRQHPGNVFADDPHLVWVFERIGVPLQAQVEQFGALGLDLRSEE